MKIGETRRTQAATRVSSTRPVDRDDQTAPRTVTDTASIMGIPPEELTPKVRAAIMQLMAEVERLRGELDQQKKRISYLEDLADQDSLVPVYNRRAFVRELSRVLSSAERYGDYSSVLYFDLNDLKTINDTHGHAAGDAALSVVAGVLVANIRESDAVGRLGGDEFGVILTRAGNDAAVEKAQALARLIAETGLDWEGATIPLEVSFGVHTFSGGEASAAIAAADEAMYTHKRSDGDDDG